jgi:hypothetical protein
MLAKSVVNWHFRVKPDNKYQREVFAAAVTSIKE